MHFLVIYDCLMFDAFVYIHYCVYYTNSIKILHCSQVMAQNDF